MLKILKGKKTKEIEVSPTLCGKLLKKSNNKYQLSMQERYVKLEGTYLRYYKNKHDAQENGSVNLALSNWVRPYDLSPDCKTFEVHSDADRTFVFEAADAKARQIWVESIEMVRRTCQAEQAAAIQTEIINNTPARIRLFDERGETGFREEILLDIVDIYPEDPDFKLRDHVERATELKEYLRDFLPELEKTSRSAARYDIMQVTLELMNDAICSRLKPILHSDHTFIADAGSLGEIHSIIMFLTSYQALMAATYCPPSSPRAKPPTYCEIFERLPLLCERYVNGDSERRGCVGAAELLVDSCHNSLSELLKKPADMVQRHRDGSFFTNAPTEIWSTLNQHLELASLTKSPILQVMIAGKISVALKHIIGMITQFVRTMDTESNPALKEVELELLCALANDNAVHIEEIVAVVDNFQMEEIRNRVNEIYDDVTVALVGCGRACLKRLTQVVMSDIEQPLKEVFTPDWLEGNQIQVAVATITDYMTDLETFLMKFWSEKFVSNLLEAIILRYTRSVVFRNEKPPRRAPPPMPPPAPVVQETIVEVVKSSFFGFGKKVVQQVVQQVVAAAPAVTGQVFDPAENTWCFADSEALGRLAQDVNVMNAFFSQRVGQEKAQDYLAIANEVSLMLQLPMNQLAKHALSRISEFPSSGQAIFDTVMACVALREEECDEEELEDLQIMMRPAIQVAAQAAIQLEQDGTPEGPLGLLYLDLVPNTDSSSSSAKLETGKSSLAQRLKDMANIPLTTLKKIIDEDDDLNEPDESSPAYQAAQARREAEHQASEREMQNSKAMVLQDSNRDLVDDVMEAMQAQQEEAAYLAMERERAMEEEEKERALIAQGSISLEGHLDKKSPAHNLWQNRWFKLSTRTQDCEPKFIYTLMWYKKQGGSVIKSADVGKIRSIVLVESNRQLAYNETRQTLMLSSEVQPGEEFEIVRENVRDSFGAMTLDAVIVHYSFAITLHDGKEHILRGSKVDKIIKWINALALASKSAYDPDAKEWNTAAMSRLQAAKDKKREDEKRQAAERFMRARQVQTIPAVTVSAAPQTPPDLKQIQSSYDEADCVNTSDNGNDENDSSSEDGEDETNGNNRIRKHSASTSSGGDCNVLQSVTSSDSEAIRFSGVEGVLEIEPAIEAKCATVTRASRVESKDSNDDRQSDNDEKAAAVESDSDHDQDDDSSAGASDSERETEDLPPSNSEPSDVSAVVSFPETDASTVLTNEDVLMQSGLVDQDAEPQQMSPASGKAKPPPKRSQLRRSMISNMVGNMDSEEADTSVASNSVVAVSDEVSEIPTSSVGDVMSPSGSRRRPPPPPKA